MATKKHSPKFLVKQLTKVYMLKYGLSEYAARTVALEKVLEGLK